MPFDADAAITALQWGSVVSAEKSTSIQYVNKLRIWAVYAVITAHVTIWMTLGAEPFTVNWWLGCWIYSLCLWSIPVFVMISGALLLDDTRQESAADFFKRRTQRIALPLIFWTAFYIVVRRVVGGEQITLKYVIKLIATAEPYYHLWYLYMIAGLYLITPPLRTYIRRASARERIFVIALIFILADACSQADILLWNNQRSIFTLFIPYIGYYMCGYELRLIDPKKVPTKYLAAGVIISMIYVAALADPLSAAKAVADYRSVFGFFSAPVVVMSIGIFWAAYIKDQRAKPPTGAAKTALQWVAPATLGIYVLHPIVLEFIRRGLSRYATKEGNFAVGIVAVPLVTFVVCYLITLLIMNIPVLRRTVC